MIPKKSKNMSNEIHVLGLSGGKDSAALAVYMRDNYPDIDIAYYFSDTGKELPEVYDFLYKLETYLGQTIKRLGQPRGESERGYDFDFWLEEYNYFLPSAQTRWCTRQLKLRPFEQWVKPQLQEGKKVISYVAIRADEPYRQGHIPTNKNIEVRLPFRDDGVNKRQVLEILDRSGLGLPAYYEWRSRSGCTFCFFQQKMEWVNLKKFHPKAFEAAKTYEKLAIEHDAPFTWTERESLVELEQPERMKAIEEDFVKRQEYAKRQEPHNFLRDEVIDYTDYDDLYGEDEGNGACLVCHK